ncbi:hypothetical protein U750_11010 [Streptococcus pseudopneumoniae G42]|nr:hypothetical protein U750_11010 [Streptococcus pseudopneumoniae G42]
MPTKEDEERVITSKDSSLPEEIKAKIKKAEEADAKRPQSEKLQDKADQLGDEIDSLTKQANKAKAEAEKKAATLVEEQKKLEEAKTAHEAAQAEFEKALALAESYKEDIDTRVDDFNETLKKVKEAKAKEPNTLLKEELIDAFTQLEEAEEAKINADDKIKDKAAAIKEAKEKIGKEYLLKAIENGDISLEDVVKELPTEDAKTTPDSTNVVYEKKSLPSDKMMEVEKAEAAEKARPESEKLQDKADQLGDEIDSLTEEANKLKADFEKKAKELEK